MKVDVVILAAGQGTRMRSARPKVLHEIGGKAMLRHVVDAAAALGEHDGNEVAVHVVVGHGADAVKQAMGDRCDYVEQQQQLGTAHAVAQALPLLSAGAKTLVLYGDVPLIKTETLQAMLDAVDERSMAVLTTDIEDPSGYGRIVRSRNGAVEAIVEHKDANAEQLRIKEVNTGIMCIPQPLLSQWLPQIGNDNAQQEYYLPDVIAMAVEEHIAIHTPYPSSHYEVQGVNNRAQLAELERVFQAEQAQLLMEAGATLADPARVDVRGNLTVGRDVFIDVNAVFSGNVVIGDGVHIEANCVISDASIAAGTHIYAHCVIEQAQIGERCNIGPFARFRPGVTLEEGAKVGNYVEVKNAHIGAGSKASHLSYIGDTSVGSGANIGAGTITCNYDGANKHRTTIGNGVFVGSNSTLVAPIELEDDSFVAAGSTITQQVPGKALAVGRGKQRNIEGWKRPEKPKK